MSFLFWEIYAHFGNCKRPFFPKVRPHIIIYGVQRILHSLTGLCCKYALLFKPVSFLNEKSAKLCGNSRLGTILENHVKCNIAPPSEVDITKRCMWQSGHQVKWPAMAFLCGLPVLTWVLSPGTLAPPTIQGHACVGELEIQSVVSVSKTMSLCVSPARYKSKP